jgi:hypothetical protein
MRGAGACCVFASHRAGEAVDFPFGLHELVHARNHDGVSRWSRGRQLRSSGRHKQEHAGGGCESKDAGAHGGHSTESSGP